MANLLFQVPWKFQLVLSGGDTLLSVWLYSVTTTRLERQETVSEALQLALLSIFGGVLSVLLSIYMQRTSMRRLQLLTIDGEASAIRQNAAKQCLAPWLSIIRKASEHAVKSCWGWSVALGKAFVARLKALTWKASAQHSAHDYGPMVTPGADMTVLESSSGMSSSGACNCQPTGDSQSTVSIHAVENAMETSGHRTMSPADSSDMSASSGAASWNDDNTKNNASATARDLCSMLSRRPVYSSRAKRERLYFKIGGGLEPEDLPHGFMNELKMALEVSTLNA